MKKIVAWLLCLLMLTALLPAALAEGEPADEPEATETTEAVEEASAEEPDAAEIAEETEPAEEPDEAEEESYPTRSGDKIVIDSTAFPDETFRNWIKNGGNAHEIPVKKSGSTYYITRTDADALDTLDCSGKGIKSAKGIENFPNLDFLVLEDNALSEIDLSGNTKLTTLRLGSNKLTKLNVTMCPKLVYLEINGNQIKSINLKYCKKLETFNAYGNKLTAIDVSKNVELKTLDLGKNSLKKIDVSANAKLMFLIVKLNENITVLDVSNNPDLMTLDCACTDLDTLNVSKNPKLVHLNCSSIFLKKLDVSKNPLLRTLSCGENRLSALDVSKNTALEELHCGDNLLTALDVSNCAKLKEFACENNFLEQLNVSACANLEILDCSNNDIVYLNVSGNTKLTELECFCNRIWNIGGLSNCKDLKVLHCNDNEMPALSLTGLVALTDKKISPQTVVTYADVVESGGQYTFDMSVLFETGSQKLNVSAYDGSYSYNKSTGIMTLPKKLTEFPYYYDTGAGQMKVVVKTPYPGMPTIKFDSGAVQYKGKTPYVIYNGTARRPSFTVYDSKGKVIDPIYYSFAYTDNVKPGTAYLSVRMKGTMNGSQIWFKIYLPPTDATTVENVGNGIRITWNAVADAKGYVIYRRAWNLISSGWTTFERWNNTTKTTWTDTKVYAGTRYQYGVKAYYQDPMDNYNLGEVGPLKTTVRITTRVLNSVTPGSRKLTVKWTGSSLFTGYEVQVATDAAFTKDVKTVKIDKAKTYEKTIRDLKKATTYYVRVRSYHIFEGTTYYGQWSNVLTGKTK